MTHIKGDIVTILEGRNKGIQGRIYRYRGAKCYVKVDFLTPVKATFRRRRMMRNVRRARPEIHKVILPGREALYTYHGGSYSKTLELRSDRVLNHTKIVRERTQQDKLMSLIFFANRMRLYSRKILYRIFQFTPIASIGYEKYALYLPKLSVRTLSRFQTDMLTLILKMKSVNGATEEILQESIDIRNAAFKMSLDHLRTLHWAITCSLSLPNAVQVDESSMRIERTFANLFFAARYLYNNVLMETVRMLWNSYRIAAAMYSSDRVMMKKTGYKGVINTVKIPTKSYSEISSFYHEKRGKFYTSNRVLPPARKDEDFRTYSDLNSKASFLNEELSAIIDSYIGTPIDLTVLGTFGFVLFRMLSLTSKRVENLCCHIRVASVFGNANRVRSELGNEEYSALSDIALEASKNTGQRPFFDLHSDRCDRAFMYRNGRWERSTNIKKVFI